MSTLRPVLAALAIVTVTACFSSAQDKPAREAPRGAESFETVNKEFLAAQKAHSTELRAAFDEAKKSGKDKGFKFDKPYPAPLFSPRFLAIAEANPTGPDALEAISMTLATSPGAHGRPLEIRARAIKLLREYHVTSPDICKLARRLARYDEDDAKAFVNDVIARNPDRAIQAKAYLVIVDECERKVTLRDRLKKDAKLRGVYEKREGKDKVAQHIDDGDKAAQESERVNKVLREKYADIVNDLPIGARMPALKSEDLEGRTVTLDELKGKVVVLDIWTTWCGPCKAMIPHEREMVARLKDKPFALVSISFDAEKKTLTDFLAKESMPWNHWWNGAEGKLIDTLNIVHYPTIFVLDAQGVIRFKEIKGEELEKAVNELLKETEQKTAGPGLKPGSKPAKAA